MARNPRTDAQEANMSESNTTTTATGETTNTATSANTGTSSAAAAAPAATSAGDSRFVMVNDPDNNYAPVKRSEFIQRKWQQGMSRSDITKLLNDERVNPPAADGSRKKIPYQIVFAATKGKPGGPSPQTAQTPATTAPAAEAAPTVGGEGAAAE